MSSCGARSFFGPGKFRGALGWLALLALAGSGGAEEPAERTWKSRDGRSLTGQMTALDATAVEVRLSRGGKPIKVALNLLSDEDLAYVEEWRGQGYGIRVERWPDEFRPMLNFTAKELPRDAGGAWAYATPNFRYLCDAPLAASLIHEYAKAFEATYQAIRELPLQLNPSPPEGKFVVRLFREREDYLKAGGPQGSSGVYVIKSREILVPMDALGVRDVGKRVAIDRRSYDAGTLVHEITHQVMHEWLEVLPVWLVEGLAEYLAAVPFANGRFDFRGMDQELLKYLEAEYRLQVVAKGPTPVDMVVPEDLMALTHQQWSAALAGGGSAALNYRSSLLLVYYLIHLDGKGDGTSIVAYLQQAREKQGALKEFVQAYNQAVSDYNSGLAAYNESVRNYNQELVDFRKRVDTYNQRVRVYNDQLGRSVPEAELIDVGPDPGLPPEPPLKPELPKILAEHPEGGGVIDLSRAEVEARRAIYRSRDPSQLWSDLERAFAAKGLRLQPVRAEVARPGARPVPLRPVPVP